MIGAFAEYRAAKWFAVSLDVLYSRQGSSAEITQGALGSEHKLKFNNRLNYLNIPILANFYVTNGLALKAGIQPGFLLSGKYRAKVDGGSWNTEDTKHYFKSTDLLDPGRHLLHVRTRSGHRRPLQYPGHRHRDG